jgi:hypothetical protein
MAFLCSHWASLVWKPPAVRSDVRLGVPRIDGDCSRFFPPATIVRQEPFVLFLDELNAASHEIQKAFYSLILDLAARAAAQGVAGGPGRSPQRTSAIGDARQGQDPAVRP